jgi:RNA polymerase sigma factor (sigma-70 family)
VTLAELLERHRAALLGFAQRRGGRVLRFETAEDLVQGVHLRALEHAHTFDYRGEKQFLEWMYAVARSHLADRHAYWLALRRRPGALVRLTQGVTTGGGAAEPGGRGTGPATFAERRDELELAYAALAALLERDQRLVRWSCEGLAIDEMAQRLEISYDAAERARLRAVERFRKAYRLARRARGR